MLLPDQLSFRVLQLTLQPEWRKRSKNKNVRCENGDPFNMLLKKINELIIGWAEDAVNWLIGKVNSAISWIPGNLKIEEFCMANEDDPKRCERDRESAASDLRHFTDCEDEDFKGGLDLICYYQRVRAHMHTSPSLLHPPPHTHVSIGHLVYVAILPTLTHVEHLCA